MVGFFFPFKLFWRNLWRNSVKKINCDGYPPHFSVTNCDGMVTVRHKLWRNGNGPSQIVTESDGIRHKIVTDITQSVTKILPWSNYSSRNCDGKSVTISVTIFDCDGKSPSQFPSETICDGIFPSQIFRHKKLWRTFFRHKLWRIRHKWICDKWNCDRLLSVTISVTNWTFPSQFQNFSSQFPSQLSNFFCSECTSFFWGMYLW